ncbi:MAG: methylmalonyl-CoA epimerase [Candidatus Marinimicrobia bacterium]|nr:methylmalonyl-CoA epimerase [Candidatus Neomarinimicrobiota bacterium]|tara:strand:- start:28006 stop:28425 length:420 start_codon:yes stop_codon:yes gene_type:complete
MNKNFKILKIDHVAIAVNSLEETRKIYSLLGMNIGHVENVITENVDVLKIHPDSNEHTIELLEPNSIESSVHKFLNKKGQGLHHIALEVDNIYNAIDYLVENNIQVIYSPPQKGADNKLITFIHPNCTSGVLIELCQSA